MRLEGWLRATTVQAAILRDASHRPRGEGLLLRMRSESPETGDAQSIHRPSPLASVRVADGGNDCFAAIFVKFTKKAIARRAGSRVSDVVMMERRQPWATVHRVVFDILGPRAMVAIWRVSVMIRTPPQPRLSSSGLTGLDRTIQYSREVVIESIGRGVLDTPLSRSMTAVAAASFSPSWRGALATKLSRCPPIRTYPAPTAVLRQARCTAQAQPGGCEASWASLAARSLAGVSVIGARVGIASRTRRSWAERSCAGM